MGALIFFGAELFGGGVARIAGFSDREAGYALHRCLNLRFRDGLDWIPRGDSSRVAGC
jgi:hypothetical protein